MNVIPLCKICPRKERKGFFTKLRKGEPPPVPYAVYKKTVSPIALSRLFLGIRIDLIFGNESEYSFNQSSIYKIAVNYKISLFSKIDNY